MPDSEAIVTGLIERRPTANEIADEAIKADIRQMLDELGNPPLVDRIYPNGWESEPSDRLRSLHALCLRTFAARAHSLGD